MRHVGFLMLPQIRRHSRLVHSIVARSLIGNDLLLLAKIELFSNRQLCCRSITDDPASRPRFVRAKWLLP
jgi:hypothetical protein